MNPLDSSADDRSSDRSSDDSDREEDTRMVKEAIARDTTEVNFSDGEHDTDGGGVK
ncbi:MAG: hypothetical protein GY800_05945 [Planctomycetes bacterium]|nr:hypothetical protein [Planctomycetota bacterium]